MPASTGIKGGSAPEWGRWLLARAGGCRAHAPAASPGSAGGALPVLASSIHRWHPESPKPPPPPALRPGAGFTEPLGFKHCRAGSSPGPPRSGTRGSNSAIRAQRERRGSPASPERGHAPCSHEAVSPGPQNSQKPQPKRSAADPPECRGPPQRSPATAGVASPHSRGRTSGSRSPAQRGEAAAPGAPPAWTHKGKHQPWDGVIPAPPFPLPAPGSQN